MESCAFAPKKKYLPSHLCWYLRVCVHILLFYFPLGLNIVLINSTFQTTKKIIQETETYQPLGLSNKHIQVFGVVECILKERYFKVFLFCVRVCVCVWVCVSCYAQLFEVRILYTSWAAISIIITIVMHEYQSIFPQKVPI